MALTATSITKTPLDITTALSLTDGTDYTIQAQGGVVFIAPLAVAPVGTPDDFLVVENEQPYPTITQKSGESWYAWAPQTARKNVKLVALEAG